VDFNISFQFCEQASSSLPYLLSSSIVTKVPAAYPRDITVPLGAKYRAWRTPRSSAEKLSQSSLSVYQHVCVGKIVNYCTVVS
jgi:hypothetical protein